MNQCGELIRIGTSRPIFIILTLSFPMSSTTEDPTDQTSSGFIPGGFRPTFSWRILGTPAPVFPGFEVDISHPVSDDEKPDAVWHRDRARSMLRDHPEIRDLFGHVPGNALWCLLISGAQIGCAVAVTGARWWVVFLCAYLIGAWLNVCLFNLAHECNHGLVFNKKRWDRWLFTFTSLPMFLPGHHTWWIEHHVHHNDLGAKKDFVKRRRSILLAMRDSVFGKTVPRRWRPYLTWITTPLFWPISLFMLVTQLFRAVVGLVVYFVTALLSWRLTPNDLALSILADQHLISGYDRYRIRGWAVTYSLIHVTLLAVLFLWGGWTPVLYLLLSALFMTGYLHPVMFGLILSNSHFHGHREYQPSSSYYGWLNWVTFNFGLHAEHHDLAKVPWHRLQKLRQIAPEFYDDLLKTPSYPRLALQFAFGERENFDNEDFRNTQMFETQ